MADSPMDMKKEQEPKEVLGDFKGEWAQKVISLVLTEKDKYERNSSEIREELKKIYRNFLGVFDEPYTRYTKRKKEFFALTQYHTLSSASRIYVDPKALNILPIQEEDIAKAQIWNALLPFQLKQINFYQAMNNLSIDLALFGTVVSEQGWEFSKEFTYEDLAKDGKEAVVTEKVKDDKLTFRMIPLLNCYIDSTAESIQKAPSFIISSWEEVSNLKNLKAKYKWNGDVEGIEGVKLISQGKGKDDRILIEYAQKGISQREMEVPMVEILYRYAKIPLSWVTKKDSDKDTYVEGKITVLNANGGRKKFDKDKVSLLDVAVCQYKHGKRPFEECVYIKVPRRWYGIGVGHMMLDPNAYMNRVMNQRIDNNELLQNKMFMARRGAGLDNKSIASAPGKVVTVQNMDDFKVLEVGDAKASSYQDEQDILLWAERLSHVKDISRSDKTATEAQIDESGAGEFFSIVRRNVNDYLRRVFEQFIALDQQYIEQDFMVRIVGETADFKDLDDVMGFPEEARSGLGNYRFIKVDDINDIQGQFDVEVDIDNSVPVNKAVQLQGIEKMMNAAMTDPASGLNRQEIYKEWVTLLGFKGSRFFINPSQVTMPMPGQAPMMQGMEGAAAPAPMPGVPTNLGTQ